MRELNIFCARFNNLEIALDSIGLHDEIIDRFECIVRELDIADSFFMRDHIIGDKNRFAFFPFFSQIFFCRAGDHSICRRKKRHPIFEDDHIGFQTGNIFPRLPPGKGINGIDHLNGFYRMLRTAFLLLGFSRKKKFRIFQPLRGDLGPVVAK